MNDIAERETHAAVLNKHIGSRIRLRRTLLGMSQEQLGEALGITSQQVRDYERGLDRVRTAQLRDLAELFEVPIGFFHEGQPPAEGTESSAPAYVPRVGFGDALDGFGDDTSNRRETQALLRAYNRIADPARRKQAFELLKSLTPPE